MTCHCYEDGVCLVSLFPLFTELTSSRMACQAQLHHMSHAFLLRPRYKFDTHMGSSDTRASEIIMKHAACTNVKEFKCY